MMTRLPDGFSGWLALAGISLCLIASAPSYAALLTGKDLVKALQHGGYVLVMRHGDSPATPPDKATADPQNTKLERQLDAMGRNSAEAMGNAVRSLRIRFGIALSSPTYRARETLRLARLPYVTHSELDETSTDMQSKGNQVQSAWLRAKAADVPVAGTNALIVTHAPNIAGAFALTAPGVAAGETLVLHPDGHGGAEQIARIKSEDWSEFLKLR